MLFTKEDGYLYTGAGYSNTAVPKSTTGTVTIPSMVQGYSVECIGGYSFDGCDKITKIVIPNSVKRITYSAFRECGMESIEFGNGITTISGAFESCNNLKSLVFPSSLTHLYDQVVRGCLNLKEITLPASLVYISERAISICMALEKITCLSSTPLSLNKDPVDDNIYYYCPLNMNPRSELAL